jgi:drug/metabolite transporter (DMT)-like permease
MRIADGLALALLSAFALNWGWVAQHGAARELPSLSLRRPVRSLRALFGDGSWVTGFLVGLAGWALYIAALELAPLSLVQATSAGGIGILAALARRRGEAVTRGHWAAVAVSVAGLALLAVSLAGGASAGSHPGAAGLALWVAASALVAAAATGFATGAAFGLAAGVLYAAGDVSTKAATLGGMWLVLIAVVVATHGAAFVAMQLGFQRGGALSTAGTATLFTNALPIVAGVVLFGEALPGGALGALRVVAFACVVVGAALLARGDEHLVEEVGGTREEVDPVRQLGEHVPFVLVDHELAADSALGQLPVDRL